MKFENYLTESAAYEKKIVNGWNKLQNRDIDPSISIDPGDRIAQALLNRFSDLAGSEAVHMGSTYFPVTKFWKSFTGNNKSPSKTDFMIGKTKFSLKIGSAQIISAAKNESLGTFYSALKNSDQELVNNTYFKKTNELIESFIPSSPASERVGLEKKAKKLHGECQEELSKLFEQSNKFKVEFAREGMSGIEKFGRNSDACAEFIVTSNKKGDKVDIHSVNDNSYCQSIASKMKLSVSFKSSGGRFYSSIRLMVNALKKDKKIKESKFTDFLKNKWYKLKEIFSNSVVAMLKFLGLTPEVSVSDSINF